MNSRVTIQDRGPVASDTVLHLVFAISPFAIL